MKVKDLKTTLYCDLYRYEGVVNKKHFFKYVLIHPGFKYTFWMRICNYLKHKSKFYFPLFLIARLTLDRYKYKYGIDISPSTEIGKGFYIGHFGGITVNAKAKIGNNCNISQGVTLGQSNRGKNKGCPVIGDEVYIGPGVKIVGAIRVGNNVAIGANCVVTKDIPDNSVVVGIPGRVVSSEGAIGYVNNTDYLFQAL